jgi:hypothetical protein
LPERRSEMAKIGFRAMIGGLLAAYMTESLAGFCFRKMQITDLILRRSRRKFAQLTQ